MEDLGEEESLWRRSREVLRENKLDTELSALDKNW